MAFVRVSQQSLFKYHVNNMNSSLSSLMELNIQTASQKRINRPSDDPAGASQVLSYRNQLSQIDQYQENIDTARGWLGLQDNTLIQVNTVLTRIKELAEQAASGTYDASNRAQIGFEVREQFEQLIQLANTEYEGKHIFSGHKTGVSSFVQGLAVTTNDAALASSSFSISGAAESTHLVQFLDTGTVGTDALQYRYSTDAGQSWTTATLAAGDTTLVMNGVRVTMEAGSAVSAVDPEVLNTSENNGTWLWVRPTAIYQGDDEDAIAVDDYGGNNTVAGAAFGFFQQDVMVRIDNAAVTTLDGPIEYSYSLDNGVSWVTGNTFTNTTPGSPASLVVPGGYLELSPDSGNTLEPGEQFVIRPRRAEITFQISATEAIAVNAVGKDVFGGIYFEPYSSTPTVAYGGDQRNMFEVVGRLVGYIETNNENGISQALEELRGASEHVLTQAASVGGRENRLEVSANMLTSLKLNKEARLSTVEDADVADLLTKVAQQQLMYEAVLKTSSQIMKMSLMNYL
ncbi:MAG: flagellar hook-associated protein FlgL [Desulfovibrio sp.]|nr:flagellar hook-associated protein FlgL [Desulfovibrio sp.]